MNPTEPTVEQATAYFRNMAKGKPVPIAPGRSNGLGVVHAPTTYHVTTPTNQTLAQAQEAVERKKVIRGPGNGKNTKKDIKGLAKPAKKKKNTRKNEYLTPGLE